MAANRRKFSIQPVNEGFKKSIKCFQLEEIIGSGTFSEVYRACNTETREVLALKLFRQELRTMLHYESAAKEIAFMKILNHPNIITLKVYEISRTYVYIGTEFGAFGNLKDFIKDLRNIPEKMVQCIMKQIVSALDFMHPLGIFHGDLKPHNIICHSMKANGPEIKICDFGLSEIKLKDFITCYKSGSFMYMAPEVILRHPVDVTCDLWSAGVIMYRIMFSRNLFNVLESEKDKLHTLMRKKTSPNFQGSQRYSKDCLDLLQRLLTYDKSKRIQGEGLRKHPFININPQFVLQDKDEFFMKAKTHADSACEHAKNEEFGEALVDALQSVLELKIQHNLAEDVRERRILRNKWAEYEEFISYVETTLINPPPIELDPSETISDAEFRKHLVSTPKLADSFDIGCAAEMFLREGNKEKALDLFHQALRAILPIMKNEPKSNRKKVLGRRLKKWIEYVEELTESTTTSASKSTTTTTNSES